MLEADHLTYTYHGAERRYDFTFAALPGEITAISGQSGAGKSTLLDLVAGFLRPADGTLTLDGVDLLPQPPERRPVSILFQTEILFEHLTAARNVALGLPETTSATIRAERVAAALGAVGLPEVTGQRAGTLSGGEKQRVALARTLLRGRPILLLDEPFSALDDETRATTRALVRALTEQQRWITILVSHHVDDVAALASRSYRLEAGLLTRTA